MNQGPLADAADAHALYTQHEIRPAFVGGIGYKCTECTWCVFTWMACADCGNLKDTPGHELGCETGRQEYGHA